MITRRAVLRAATSMALSSVLPMRCAMARTGLPSQGKLLFGYPPGAVGSLLGAGLTEVLSKVSGINYELMNVEGRNTRRACEEVRNAPADGATLLHAQSTSMCLLPNVYHHLGYDPIQDFTPLGFLGEYTFSLTVGPLVPKSVTNLQQYLDWVQQNPDARDIGFAIYGSQGHLAVLTLEQELSASVAPLAYTGTAMMIADIVSGRVAAGFTAAGNGGTALWADGTLRSIGVTSATRLPHWPDIMTLREQGATDMDFSSWFAWYAPSATPTDIVQQWRDTVRVMQATPDFNELQTGLLLTQPNVTVEQIPELIRLETRRYSEYVKRLRLSLLD